MRSPLADVHTYTDVLRRHIDCPECGRRVASISRRGIPGGALAAAGRLRGSLAEHLRKVHPDTDIGRQLNRQ